MGFWIGLLFFFLRRSIYGGCLYLSLPRWESGVKKPKSKTDGQLGVAPAQFLRQRVTKAEVCIASACHSEKQPF